MRDPRRGVDLAGFYQVDDAGEVGRDGVSAGVERLFAAVEDRVREADVARDDADAVRFQRPCRSAGRVV